MIDEWMKGWRGKWKGEGNSENIIKIKNRWDDRNKEKITIKKDNKIRREIHKIVTK